MVSMWSALQTFFEEAKESVCPFPLAEYKSVFYRERLQGRNLGPVEVSGKIVIDIIKAIVSPRGYVFTATGSVPAQVGKLALDSLELAC